MLLSLLLLHHLEAVLLASSVCAGHRESRNSCWLKSLAYVAAWLLCCWHVQEQQERQEQPAP
jgi:hypothetical protein